LTTFRKISVYGFIYFAQQYDGLVAAKNGNIYGKKLIKLPTPQFIVFYNGAEEMDDEVTLYMSDSYDCFLLGTL